MHEQKIIIADESRITLRTLENFMSRTKNLTVVGTARNAEELYHLLRKTNTHVVLVNYSIAVEYAILYSHRRFNSASDISAFIVAVDLIEYTKRHHQYIVDRINEQLNKPDAEPKLPNIGHILKQIGFSDNLLGFFYLRDAITLSMYDRQRCAFSAKILYHEIAIYYNTSPANVERSIRHIISKTWASSDMPEKISEMFGSNLTSPDKKPSCKLLITYFTINIRQKFNLS